MITDILKYRISIFNKRYREICDEIHKKEQLVRNLVIEQLNLENEINELDRVLERMEIQALQDIEDGRKKERG